MKRSLLVFGLLSMLVLSACTQTSETPETLTEKVARIALENDLREFAAALLDVNLSFNADGRYTIFVPSDVALLSEDIGDMSDEAVEALLRYHITSSGKIESPGFTTSYFPSLSGERFFMDNVSEDGEVMLNGYAMLTKRDINVNENIVIHVIDDVIRPLPTIAEIVSSNDSFDTLEAGLNAAGLMSSFDSDDDALVTVFAPTDDAFAAAGLNPANIAELENLSDRLRYHVVANAKLTAQIGITNQTSLLGRNILVSAENGKQMLNATATIQNGDILASNGIIHSIDAVLLPPVSFDVALSGDQEAPPVNTQASGTVIVTFFDQGNRVFFNGRVDNLSSALYDGTPDDDTVNAAHIHEAAVGVNGGIAFNLMVDADDDNMGADLSGDFVLTNAQETTLMSCGYYINVHSEDFPSGEVRGQIGTDCIAEED